MNSKQRRQAERNYLHTIVLKQPNDMRFREWDDHIYDVRVWCNKNARAGWRLKDAFFATTFSFTKNEDAMMFALRWS